MKKNLFKFTLASTLLSMSLLSQGATNSKGLNGKDPANRRVQFASDLVNHLSALSYHIPTRTDGPSLVALDTSLWSRLRSLNVHEDDLEGAIAQDGPRSSFYGVLRIAHSFAVPEDNYALKQYLKVEADPERRQSAIEDTDRWFKALEKNKAARIVFARFAAQAQTELFAQPHHDTTVSSLLPRINQFLAGESHHRTMIILGKRWR